MLMQAYTDAMAALYPFPVVTPKRSVFNGATKL
jgi:hypothetical protein